MRNTALLLLLLLGLVGAWFLLSTEEKVQNNDWTVSVPSHTVDKVFLADRKGNSILLTKQKSKWYMADSILVKQNAINNLLQTIEKVTLKYRPSKNAQDYMIKSIATNGIKVEVYGKDVLKSTFYVGGLTNDETGTYIMKEGAQQAYVMHVPNQVAGLRTRFSTRPNDWRSLLIFDVDSDDVEEVRVQYPAEEDAGFKIVDKRIEPLSAQATVGEKEIQKTKIESYLKTFQFLGAEHHFENQDMIDSLQKITAFCNLEILYEGKEVNCTFYPVGTEKPVDRLFMLKEESLYLVQWRNFGALFRSYQWFFDE